MTEQIKSAIAILQAEIKHHPECSIMGESLDTAIRSMQAWEEVIKELKNMRDIIWQDTDDEARIVRANAWDKIETLNKAIDIIKQKLAGIEE